MKKLNLILTVALLGLILLSCSLATNTEEKQVKMLNGSYYFSMNQLNNTECIKEYETITFLDNVRFSNQHTTFRKNYTLENNIHNGYYQIINNEVYFFEDSECKKTYYFLHGDGKKDLCSMHYVVSNDNLIGRSAIFNMNFIYKKETNMNSLDGTYLYSKKFFNNNELKEVHAKITLNANHKLMTRYNVIRIDETEKNFEEIGFYRIIDNFVCFYKDAKYLTPLSFNGFNYLEIINQPNTEKLFASNEILNINFIKISK